MKVLYAIQGTGNGHLARAMEIVPLLLERCDLDILISGTQCDLELPFSIDYRYKGISFIFGKKGGVDLKQTWKRNHITSIYKEINTVPIQKYDLVINDFEPISAWAAKLKEVPCIALSHQSAVVSGFAPKPNKIDPLGEMILNHYAPYNHAYGFHFERYDDFIFTPIIRQQIRALNCKNKGHYTVYLPAYDDQKLIQKLGTFSSVKWEVFSKHTQKAYQEGNISIRPINNNAFLTSFANCEGILCGAGFETPAEALYLNKKLMVIPMKAQFEQQLNAAALKQMDVPVIKSLKKKHFTKIDDWLTSDKKVEVNYPDVTADILDKVLSENSTYVHPIHPFLLPDTHRVASLK